MKIKEHLETEPEPEVTMSSQGRGPLTVVRANPRVTDAELDALPYGAIQLDQGGVILRFNHKESHRVGIPPEEVLGKNFFTEVAPCTQVQEFQGAFSEGVRTGKLRALFDFDFPFADRKYRAVTIRMLAGEDHTAWIFITPTQGVSAELREMFCCQ